MLKLYNTATRKKETVHSTDGTVTMYTCGLTVYASPHIGNWRTFIFYDTLARALSLNDLTVHHVQNITDVGHLVSDGDDGEDKLDKQAKLRRKTAWEVAEEYITEYDDGNKQLNMRTPYKMPRATDHITEQIDMIQTLEGKGLTYIIDDGVYFDTAKWPQYGQRLLNKNAKADRQFARISENSQKHSPEDFALWKFSQPAEQRDMEWESPWGKGFPGWHIECSAMAKKYLGDTIDIHAGGIDHIPIHHTNEIAQSEAANDAEFARIWAHSEFILVNGTKMSKSLGNLFTLRDITDHGFDPLDFRLMVLQGHYRTETNFSWDNVQAAHNRLANLLQLAELRWSAEHMVSDEDVSETITSLQTSFVNALNDDVNTPQALQVLSELEALAPKLNKRSVAAFHALLHVVDDALGLHILSSTPDIEVKHYKLIEERQLAKSARDFAHADATRNQLQAAGIQLLDTPAGTFWQRFR